MNNKIPSCPRCGILVTDNTNRLITDSCGHRKCRLCLLSEDECWECLQQKQCDIENKKNQIFDTDLVVESEDVPVPEKDVESKNIRRKGKKVVSIPAYIRREQNNSDSGIHYYCTQCCRKFKSRSQQYYHLKCGSDTYKKYKCQQCDKAFATSSHLKYHMETHVKRTYSCKLCSKSFTNRMVLQKHEKHHYTAPLECAECRREFRSKCSLSAHIRKQHDDKDLPYTCEECQKSFVLKSALKQHMQKHFEKKYTCQYCDKRFQRNYTLKLHLKKHTKGDCFICGICLHKFSDSAVLMRHVKLHQDTIKFRCKECDITIMRKDNMLRHVRTIHPGKSYEDCVEMSEPISSNRSEELETRASYADKPTVTEPKTVENSAVIKCIGNVAPMKVPAFHVPAMSTIELNINTVQKDIDIAPLNAGSIASVSSKKKKVKKKYDPIKMYRKILASDCEEESVNESESDKEEMHNRKAQCAANSTADGDMVPALERRVTPCTSNFSEMHWRKNFKYTYEYQDF